MLASPQSSIALGSVEVRLYPVFVLGGFFAFMWMTGRQWERGGGVRTDALWLCVLAAPAALVGARLYSIASEAATYAADPRAIVDVAGGGLAIFGAVAGGTLAIVAGAQARRFPVPTFLDCCMPGLALGQAIGRFGNWVNSELIGAPSDLPWAVYVNPADRPAGYESFETFHPAFLYESALDVGLFVAIGLLWAPMARRFRPGAIVAVYLIGYGLIRFLVETVRIDVTPTLGVFRLNQIVAIGSVGTGLVLLVLLDRRRTGRG